MSPLEQLLGLFTGGQTAAAAGAPPPPPPPASPVSAYEAQNYRMHGQAFPPPPPKVPSQPWSAADIFRPHFPQFDR
jgi:hypothetical protein